MVTLPFPIIHRFSETKSILKETKAEEKQLGLVAFPENVRKGEERVKPKVNIVPSNSSVKLVLNVFKLVGGRGEGRFGLLGHRKS